ncbi:hypothetical protein BH18VER2_BH18VER2_11390 [soil metagenome]
MRLARDPRGVVLLFCLFLAGSASARTRAPRKPNPITVVLQPFFLARSVVHTVAEPIVTHAPRTVAAVATAPIRVAYMVSRLRTECKTHT